MMIDMHTHIAGTDWEKNGNYLSEKFREGVAAKLYCKSLNIDKSDYNDEQIFQGFLKLLDQSSIDKAVLLAFDGVHDQEGRLQRDRSLFITSNQYVAQLAKDNPNILFGASIHPYRKDALEELESCVKQNACLVKWIPSAQGIDMDNPICDSFYDYLSSNNIPLLCHCGVEHSLGTKDNLLNHPSKFERALKAGVSVIAAHCGGHMFIYEPSYYKAWKKMLLRYDNLFGDISAFVLPTRVKYLRDIVSDVRLHGRVLYGSDFPAIPLPVSMVFKIGIRKYRELREIDNYLERSYQALREYGIPQSIFTNFEKLFLR